MKKEGGLPEGPVLEALLCAESGDKKPELKEEELLLDCPVRARESLPFGGAGVGVGAAPQKTLSRSAATSTHNRMATGLDWFLASQWPGE